MPANDVVDAVFGVYAVELVGLMPPIQNDLALVEVGQDQQLLAAQLLRVVDYESKAVVLARGKRHATLNVVVL